MISGIIAVIIFAGIIFYLDYRICKIEKQINDVSVKTELLIYDFIKRNKKNIKKVNVTKEEFNELFK